MCWLKDVSVMALNEVDLIILLIYIVAVSVVAFNEKLFCVALLANTLVLLSMSFDNMFSQLSCSSLSFSLLMSLLKQLACPIRLHRCCRQILDFTYAIYIRCIDKSPQSKSCLMVSVSFCVVQVGWFFEFFPFERKKTLLCGARIGDESIVKDD